jgi:hypothetical protein
MERKKKEEWRKKGSKTKKRNGEEKTSGSVARNSDH